MFLTINQLNNTTKYSITLLLNKEKLFISKLIIMK